MACFRPLQAYQTTAGDILFYAKGTEGKSKNCKAADIRRELTLPCGQCVGCRLERSRQWAVRVMHESQMHEDNCFITLTYNDECIPPDYSLCYKHFQLFMKRLRRRCHRVRFYMCGEYGEARLRPHFHACLFGFRPTDMYPWRQSSSGFPLSRSPFLEELWSKGSVEVGDVSFESAAYVARYVMKKVTGKEAESHYEAVDGETGEVYYREPEFTRMSLKPGIGATWFRKYHAEVFPADRVVVRGVECKPPTYYKRLVDADSSDRRSDHVDYARYLKSLQFVDDQTPERLADREKVCLAKVFRLKRSIE